MTPGKYQFDEWQIRTRNEPIQRVRGGGVEGAVIGAFFLRQWLTGSSMSSIFNSSKRNSSREIK